MWGSFLCVARTEERANRRDAQDESKRGVQQHVLPFKQFPRTRLPALADQGHCAVEGGKDTKLWKYEHDSERLSVSVTMNRKW